MLRKLKGFTSGQGLSPKHIRQLNRQSILEHLYRNKGLSKSELSNLTQLSIPAITKILDSLVYDGWIMQQDDSSKMRGNHKGIFRVSKSALDTICVYISPHKLHAIAVDNEITPISSLLTHQISPQTPEHIIEDIIAIVVAARKQTGNRPYRLALACHGQVDTRAGVSLQMAQAPWETSIELKYILETRLKTQVLIDNDCVMIALAEKWLNDKPVEDYCILNIDYGIGASFIIGGDVYRGKHFASGQIGHVTLDPDGEKCGCGRNGCLETIASIKAIETKYNQQANSKHYFSFEEILLFFKQNNVLAETVVLDSARAIGQSLYNFLITIDINHIILYGKCCELGADWLDEIKNQTLENPFESEFSLSREQTTINFGELDMSELLTGISYLWVEKELEELG
ncbi:MAG: ROK family protein [Vibrio sp.]